MSDFHVFHPDEQNLLAGSLYKVGMWISHIDDDGECIADEQEKKALEAVLKKSASKFSSHPIISELATETLRRENYWANWEKDTDGALNDVAQSIKLLDGRLVDNEVKAYKELVMLVATSIAGAFDENVELEETGMWGKLSNMVIGVANPSLKSEMNTSPEEDSALTELAEVLNG